MANSVSKISGTNPGSTAQDLANKWLPAFKYFDGTNTSYFTYPDIASANIPTGGYVNIDISDTINNGTLPIPPNMKMFPR